MNKLIKRIIYGTFFILLPLGEAGWGLTSCRTVSQKADSVVAHDFSLSDSLGINTRFEFDKLDIYFNDNDNLNENLAALGLDTLNSTHPPRGLGGYLSISGGRLTKTKTKTKTEHKVDSVSVSNERFTAPVFTPPKPNKWFIAGILIVIGVIIIGSRTRK